MTDEQWTALKELARAYTRARADCMILSGLLALSQSNQVPPTDWRGELERLRTLPYHRQALEELEALLDKAEQERREAELLRLLMTLPTSDSVN